MPNDMPALADMDEESDTDLLQQGTDDESMPATANSALLGSFLTESRYTACFLVFFLDPPACATIPDIPLF